MKTTSMRTGTGPMWTARRGFSIVELMVAIVIIALGVLGIASTSAAVARLIGGGSQQTVAATLAEARFEELRSIWCRKISPNKATTRGITESWSVKDSTRVKVVTDSVFYVNSGITTVRVYRTMIPCT
jgi:prepilin-type N-terminal cleavage/methylation domain-containing protein